MDDSFKIMGLNCNGIRNKQIEFFDFLIRNSIHVACISETKLNSDVRFSHTDFRIMNLFNETGDISHGGVAIVAHKSVRLEIMPSLELEIIEAIGIRVRHAHFDNLAIIAVYYTGTAANQDSQKYRRDLQRLSRIRNAIMIGDWNSRHTYWGCQSTNTAGRVLYEELCKGDFEIAYPPSPTYHPGRNRLPSTLDLMMYNTTVPFEPVRVGEDLGSDHLPILTKILIEPDLNNHYNEHLCFAKADWNRFKSYLNSHIDLKFFQLKEGLTTRDVDERVAKLTSTLNEAARISVPRFKSKPQDTLISPNIQSMIQQRRRMKRLLQRSGSQDLRQQYNCLKNQVEQLCANKRNEQFQRVISTFSPDVNYNKDLWRMSKVLRGKKSQIPFLRSEDRLLLTEAERANALADQFERNHETTVNSPTDPATDRFVKDQLQQLAATPGHNLDFRTLVTTKEVKSLIKNLPNHKAPGDDKINAVMLKNCSRKCIVAITYLMNACISLSYFPSKWKIAVIIPICKPSKPRQSVSSYRPISLLSLLGKILERLVLSHLKQHLETHEIIPKFQFGFQQGHSTTHQIKRVTNIIRDGFERGCSTGMVLLDLSCAFDTVWQDALVAKLFEHQFPVHTVKIIQSFLSNRYFKVKVSASYSSSRPIAAGVPQGAVLSPVLFNIYTADVPVPTTCEMAAFADDVAMLRTAKRADTIRRGLNDAVKDFTKYTRKWKLKVCPPKTKAVFFTRRRAARAFPKHPITVLGDRIDWSSKAKYLGVWLDQKTIFRDHVDEAIKKAGKCVRSIYALISRNSRLYIANKVLLYILIVRPIMLYASPSWGDCAATHLNRLQIYQNRILKMCLNRPFRHSTAAVHEEADVEPVLEFIARISDNFIQRSMQSSNPLISTLFDND